MKSHEYAERLQKVADLLAESPEFELPSYMDSYLNQYGAARVRFYNDKEPFLAAVRALGSGRKGGNEQDLEFIHGDLRLIVNRSAVCRLVKPAQPAEFECDPLLSQAEESELTSDDESGPTAARGETGAACPAAPEHLPAGAEVPF
jgi:hypothetical protein